ncbi:EAL domain-containing protein [Calothrix sp. NIES-2098]|uniref:EAL domain-containing protein n=1 Tax=Calothrix sp. NIES-2098 TaxID=1954171 RepID=UPI000B5E327A|nr:diguanylate cyclase/phosphodiesterase with Chase sensor [Calothrix sp. NIES-2098]
MISKLFKKFFPLTSAKTAFKRPLPTLSLKQYAIAASIITTGFILGVRQLGGLQFLELVAFDQMVRLQPDAEPDPRMLIVKITEADIKKQKQWPLSDAILSQALQKLQQAKPKVIGLDLYRDMPQPPGYQALLQELQKPNVITIKNLGDRDAEEVSTLPGISTEQVGFNDLLTDPDGKVRRNLIYAYQGQEKFYSFSLRVSQKYLADRGISLKITPDVLLLGKTVFKPISSDAGGYQNIDSLGYQVLISYRSAKQVAQEVTFTDVLQGNFDPIWVKDKVVLIGTSAPSLKDVFFTPYSAGNSADYVMSGVTLHAQLVSQLLSTTLDQKPLFWFWPEWVEAAWVWIWSLIGGFVAWRFRHPLTLLVLAGLSLVALFSICLSVFSQAGWIPILPPALASIATGVSIIAYKQFYNTYYDALTGLPNQAQFLKYLKTAIAVTKYHQNARFAVFFLDIDRFKTINESFSHHTGDQLLVKFTQRLKTYTRNKGILARVGGDEFAILLANITDTNEATSLADQLQQEMAFVFEENEQEIFMTISIGIAFNQTELSHKPEDLLRDAHTAMYRAKDLGKARHEVFATGMHIQAVKRFQLEIDLRHALEMQEFYLQYQPIVSIADGLIVGFEALVRWQHPQHGFISPVEFITIAEDTGLIIPLGKWILQEACRQLSVWQALYPTDPPLTMSINLSGQQLTQPDLVEFVEQTLQATGLDGRNVKLEITESVAMKDVEAAISILLKLRTLNIRLSIDDFGTGYSSLSYLHRFPVNTLKVDRSFVNRMGETEEDMAIVQTIIMLSHILGMDVIAEGVETEAQQKKLQMLGCEYGQGYFFSKPLDSKSVIVLLDNQFNKKQSKTESDI